MNSITLDNRPYVKRASPLDVDGQYYIDIYSLQNLERNLVPLVFTFLQSFDGEGKISFRMAVRRPTDDESTNMSDFFTNYAPFIQNADNTGQFQIPFTKDQSVFVDPKYVQGFPYIYVFLESANAGNPENYCYVGFKAL